jgi:unsaturated chondroitin disaccharide hydrolase
MSHSSDSPPNPKGALAVVEAQFAFAVQQYGGLLARIAEERTRVPYTFKQGQLKLVTPREWTSGFFPGSLWFIYEYTRNPKFKAAAATFTARLEGIQSYAGTHDIGFMLNCSYGQGWRLTGDSTYREVLIAGARTLVGRYNPRVGQIRSWDFPPWKYPVIIDNLMNLELLFWAHAVTGEPIFAKVANSHASTTLTHHFRADGSSFHLVDYEPSSGDVVRRQTVQGQADTSAWARGQAWGLYGYTMAYRFTQNPAYLAQAQRIADFIINHPRLPDDKVPFWDFDAPGIPDALRDSSAAAIMASALLELSDYTTSARAGSYLNVARQQILTLASSGFRAALGENGGFLLMHGVGYLKAKTEVDCPLAYGDYYFLEALLRYRANFASPAASRAPGKSLGNLQNAAGDALNGATGTGGGG